MKYLVVISRQNLKWSLSSNFKFGELNPIINLQYIENKFGQIIIIGDCVNLTDHISELEGNSDISKTISQLNGNFHCYFVNEDEGILHVFNSLWGIIPLYYTQKGDELIFSGSLSEIKKYTQNNSLNKKYLLQSMIFNYSLSDDTYWKNISVLAVNSYMLVAQDLNCSLKRYFNIEDYFVETPKSGVRVLEGLADLFIHETTKFFPAEKFAISFTGGFDGRTLVSIAGYAAKDFFTYSFGNTAASDLALPQFQSKELGVEFQKILLDKNYAEGFFRNNFHNIIFKSDGKAGISRAHYNHAAELLSQKTKFILTGNFGSEILRSMHITGVMFSSALYHVFNSSETKIWIDKFTDLSALLWLNMEEFTNEWNETIEEIASWAEQNYDKSKNLWLYSFVMQDVLRKYFGPEIVMQSQYLINRTPYLSIDFIKELLKTNYAGAYGPFFTHNPIKRFKGQELYAHIIKLTSPQLFRMQTNKGYSPADILSIMGKFKLVINFARKKLTKTKANEIDPFGVGLALSSNVEMLSKYSSDTSLFNSRMIQNGLLSKSREFNGLSLRALSILLYISSEGGNA